MLKRVLTWLILGLLGGCTSGKSSVELPTTQSGDGVTTLSRPSPSPSPTPTPTPTPGARTAR
jgi:hypothetical protein